MLTPRPTAARRRPSTIGLRSLRVGATLVALLAVAAGPSLFAQRIVTANRASVALEQSAASDAGQLPLSQPLSITLRLAPSAAQASALDQLLSAQISSGSPGYHHWLTPEQFGNSFGATEAQISLLTSWVGSQGLSVSAVNPSRTRVEVTGTADQVQHAFAVTIHRYAVAGQSYFANAAEPTLPAEVSALIAGVSGLDNLPSARIAASTGVTATPVSAKANKSAESETADAAAPDVASADSLETAAAIVNANNSAILTLNGSACSGSLSQTEVDGWRALLRQANAQGITVLATSGCTASGSTSFPSALGEVTALTLAPSEASSSAAGIETRPKWQAAAGLPDDGTRAEPDFAANSVAEVAQTVATLVSQTGNRIGDLSPALYSLAKTPGLFTQPDSSTGTGEWQPATGLGQIDVKTLLKVYPRGTNPTLIDFQSTSYNPPYGTSVTLRANISTTAFAAFAPTGTVTFTTSDQTVLGSASVSAGGASLDTGALPVGTYTLTASYSGDANYAASSKSGVILYVLPVTAALQATLSPSGNVPYGATATVTSTVTLPGSSAAPSGAVSAQVQGITGATYSGNLSANPGGNSGTANINIPAPPPGSYTVSVSCDGNKNFSCQTPVLINLKTIKGNSKTTLTVNPPAPQAGQTIYVTAVVSNGGNGAGTYSFGGSLTFYDSDKVVSTVPVAGNQATVSISLSGTRSHILTAIYSGDTNWGTSSSAAISIQPTILADTLTLSTNTTGGSSLAGVNIVFSGTVNSNISFGSGPTGWVTFFDSFNGAIVQLGPASVLVANGPTASVATFATTGLLAGVHRISAQYTGDDNYNPVTSPVLTLTISDFGLSMTPASLNLGQGKTAQVSVLVGINGYSGAVSLGCVAPAGSEATCKFSPASVTGGGVSTLTIVTTGPTSASQQASLGLRSTAAAGASLAMLLLLVVPGGRRRRLPALLLVLLSVSLTAGLGCGAGLTSSSQQTATSGGTPATDSGTPLGTQNYTITAAGLDGVNAVRHSYQYQVTVQ